MALLETFAAPGQFWRGNIHGHSTASDGHWSPAEVVAAYRREGYDFIALTDHFLDGYGFPITDTAPLRTPGFTTILGAEVHAPETSRGMEWHILAVGLPADFAPTPPTESGPELAARCLEAGAFVAVAHPHWYNLSIADALSLGPVHAVEVYNHTCACGAGRGDGAAFWDLLLSEGQHHTGIAVDDSHFDPGGFDGFGGWVMVKAMENTPEALLAALKAGHFYASQGPRIDDIRRDGDSLHVECSPAAQVLALGPGALSRAVPGPDLRQAELPLAPFEGGWLRIEVKDALGRRAWSNPLWLEG